MKVYNKYKGSLPTFHLKTLPGGDWCARHPGDSVLIAEPLSKSMDLCLETSSKSVFTNPLKNTAGKIVMEKPSVSGVIHFCRVFFFFLIQK